MGLVEALLLWSVFGVLILAMLALDLGVFHRRKHAVGVRESLVWTGVWIALAMAFNLGVYLYLGEQAGLEFFTGYVIEKSLSVDNIFVFLLIFSYFRVDPAHQHKVLFWGILGALVARAVFIAAGIAILEAFHWTIYLMGALLIVTGIRMLRQAEREIHPDRNPVLRLFTRWFRTTDQYHGDRFFVVRNGRRLATPLFVVLLVVETSDLVFAVDSIPAILAITTDPFIVYTSNVFAILGLRSLYFALAGILQVFHHLHFGLSGVLVFVGLKMVASDAVHVPVAVSLGVIASLLALSVLASLLWPRGGTPVPAIHPQAAPVHGQD